MSRKKTAPYEEGLNERLKDSAYAAEYLNAHLGEDDDHAVEAFLLALRDVATAHGFASVAKKSDLGRESLYKTLSKSGNPKIETLSTLLNAMGLKLSVEAKVVKRKRAS
jgi:probable addiction module antidote protein